MSGSLLLTSFTTWKPEQPSNSSDDLLGAIASQAPMSMPSTLALHFLRQIPVDFTLAPRRVIRQIEHLQPSAVICCGMGESRTYLDLESTAFAEPRSLRTAIDLDWLASDLPMTRISHDAGRFVCNGLYYTVLNYIEHHRPGLPCVFVHVPRLTPANQASIVQDFWVVLGRMASLVSQDALSLAAI